MVVGSATAPPTLNVLAPGGDNYIVAEIAQAWTCGVREVSGYSLEVLPDLVTALPTVANGGITVNLDGSETIRYTIRADAVWEDGAPVSGYDFEFTYDTIMNPDNPIYKAIYEDIIPGSVEAGPKYFRFTLAQPTIQAETIFGTILPKHQVEGTDFMNDYDTTPWLSCGPFTFDSWDEATGITFVRNANYWKADPETRQELPYLDSLVFRFIEDAGALAAAFEAGTVQVFSPSPDLADHRRPARGGRGPRRGAARTDLRASRFPVRGEPAGAQWGIAQRVPHLPAGGRPCRRQGPHRQRAVGG